MVCGYTLKCVGVMLCTIVKYIIVIIIIITIYYINTIYE